MTVLAMGRPNSSMAMAEASRVTTWKFPRKGKRSAARLRVDQDDPAAIFQPLGHIHGFHERLIQNHHVSQV